MRIVADTHVHLYPWYNLSTSFDWAWKGLGKLLGDGGDRAAGEEVFHALLLTERRDCHAFADLRDGKAATGERWRVRGCEEVGAVAIASGDAVLHVIAGRQIVCRERIEVLALTVDLDLPDGRPLGDAIDTVLAAGGIPVIPWSPGKWLGERGRIIREILPRYGPAKLLLGDTTLRPSGWSESRITRMARAGGFRVVAGSDPLPLIGEEPRIGSYGVVCSTKAFDPTRPVASLRGALAGPDVSLRCVGRRGSPASVLWRLIRNRFI